VAPPVTGQRISGLIPLARGQQLDAASAAAAA